MVNIISSQTTKIRLRHIGLEFSYRQWGKSLHGWVTFPVSYTSYRTIVTCHAGREYMNAKVKEESALAGFTLDVADNSDIYKDSQWLAVGK